MSSLSWNSRDLELLPDDGKRYESDLLQSPLLPGFSCPIDQLFDEIMPVA
jgi:hypothetical protein